MKRAAVFFDRDNTLIANDGYLGDPNGVKLVDGAADAVARARELGYAVVVFSNQSGVARGMFGEEAVHAVNHRLDDMLLDENPRAVIDRHEFCPFHPEASVEKYRQDSDLRKPRPGMILQAERQLALDLSRSWVVGDAPRDIDAGKAAGCRTVLVKNGTLAESPASMEAGEAKADFEVASLAEAMDAIARTHEAKEATTPCITSLTATPPAAPAAVATAGAVEPAVESAAESALEARTSAPSHTEPRQSVTDADDEPEIPRGKSRTEILLGQILEELRRRHEHPEHEFSVSKLMAGVVQVMALGAIVYAYIIRSSNDGPGVPIAVGIFLQVFTIALLIMGRQK